MLRDVAVGLCVLSSAEVQAAVSAVSTVGGAFAAHPAAAEADLELAAVPARKVKVILILGSANLSLMSLKVASMDSRNLVDMNMHFRVRC